MVTRLENAPVIGPNSDCGMYVDTNNPVRLIDVFVDGPGPGGGRLPRVWGEGSGGVWAGKFAETPQLTERPLPQANAYQRRNAHETAASG